MKKNFLFALLVAGAGLAMVSCNGTYDANPDVDNSNIINPLNPPKPYEGPGANDAFDWTGTDPMSAKVDDVNWQATSCIFMDAGGGFNVMGSVTTDSNNNPISISFPKTVTAGGVYEFGPNFPNYSASYTSKVSNDANNVYASNFVGGKMKILEIDASHIKGLFYFTGMNPFSGLKKNITYGYFNAQKFP